MLNNIVKLVFLFFSFQTFSQSFTYRIYNVNQGLPSSQTYDVIQDRQKYIWVATDRGVSRFDGYTFKNFTTAEGLLDNTVFSLYEDDLGRIWFLSYCGKLSYYFRNKIHPYPYNHKITPHSQKPAAAIRSFRVLKDQSIVIGTMGNGAYHISNKGTVKVLTRNNLKYCSNYVLEISDSLEYLYHCLNHTVKSTKGVSLYYRNNKVLEKELKKPAIRNAFMLKRKNGHYIFSPNRFIMDIYCGRLVDSTISNNVISLYEDTDSCLWIGYLNGGVEKFAPNQPPGSKRSKIYFPHDQITKVMEDYEHGFWFTTLHSGIIYAPNIHVESLNGSTKKNDKEKTVALAHNFKHKVFVGTNKGTLLVYQEAKLSHENYFPDYIRTIFYDTIGRTLHVSSNIKTYLHTEKKNREIRKLCCLSYLRARDNGLLAGTYKGILKNFYQNSSNFYFSSDGHVRGEAMVFDDKNTLWTGSFSGLYYLKGEELIKKKGNPLFNLRITSMVFMNGALYFSTIDKGLIKMEGERVKNYSTKEGLPSDIVNSIIQQNDTILWLATSKGVCRFNTTTEKVVFILDTRKGLLNNEVKDIELLNDTLYALTNEGVSFFNTKKVFKNATAPVVHIQDFRLDTVSYIMQQKPVFKHSRNYLTFYVAGLTYKEAGNVKYVYRLKGYSGQWRTTSNSTIQFAFVPPGNYTFEVKAENEDGLLSEQAATFQFTISEPLWKRTWFQVLLLFSGTSVLVLVLLIRIKKIKEKNKLLEQLSGFKQQALTMQMNPHFIFNLLGSVQSYVLAEDTVKASKYIAMFAKLMRKSLENSRNELIAFEEEMNTLRLYVDLESLRIANKIKFKFDYDAGVLENLLIPPMLIQPHIENAIKHAFTSMTGTGEKEISITFTLTNKILYAVVEDNGIGINKAKELKKLAAEHVSAGLEVTKNRLELLCRRMNFPFFFSIADKQVLNQNNTGTQVKFIIPYTYTHESLNR